MALSRSLLITYLQILFTKEEFSKQRIKVVIGILKKEIKDLTSTLRLVFTMAQIRRAIFESGFETKAEEITSVKILSPPVRLTGFLTAIPILL